MYATNTASIGISVPASQIKNIDPLLEQPICNGAGCELKKAYEVLRLSAASPAVNASVGTFGYMLSDYEKQSRIGAADIGADEYDRDHAIAISALDESNAGPNAISFDYSYFTVLPIKLVSFNASYNKQQVDIRWTVAVQEKVQRYEIEWRTDFSNFKKIAETKAVEGKLSYTANHLTPEIGHNYYRLKTVDEDGTAAVFEEKVVNVFASSSVKIYPNPATKEFKLDFGYMPSKSVQLKLVNSIGKSVLDMVIAPASSYQVPISNLGKGIYFVQIIEEGKQPVSLPIIINP